MFKSMSIQKRVLFLVIIILVCICACISFSIWGISQKQWITYVDEEVHTVTDIVTIPEEERININREREDVSDGEKKEDQNDLTSDVVFMSRDVSSIIGATLYKSLGIMGIFMVIGVFCVWMVVKQALRPVSKLSYDIAKVDVGMLNKQLPIPDSKDEVTELIISFNHMLTRLNDSFESQKRFSATAAHELKTPLAAIIANIEVLELDDVPAYEDCLKTLALAKESACRMEHLVQDLLQAYANQISQKKEHCDLRKICENIGNVCMAADDKKLCFQIDGKLSVRGDSIMLERAISNLIENAFRYNCINGKVAVILKENTLTVKDTGVGIPKKDLDRICEPFYRVDVSRSRELGGSGLGLSIAKQIFDQYGVFFEISSELEAGTEVTVRFPEEMISEMV